MFDRTYRRLPSPRICRVLVIKMVAASVAIMLLAPIGCSVRRVSQDASPPDMNVYAYPKAANGGGGDEPTLVQILYGTDRESRGHNEPYRHYGTDQISEAGRINYGICYVSVPPDHAAGHIERPFLDIRLLENPYQHFMLTGVFEIATADRFRSAAQVVLNGASNRDALVYVHGFNNSFEEAALRTAQIVYDVDFPGVAFMYSWASKESPDPVSYNADYQTVDGTIARLKSFLLMIAEVDDVEKIHLVAHSMGSRALTIALSQMVRELDATIRPRFANLILAAPDISVNVYLSEIVPFITDAADRVTIYASDSDKALKAAHTFSAHPRVGDAGDQGEDLVLVDGIDMIDASDAVRCFFCIGHDYAFTLVEDFKGIILQDLSIEQRGLNRHTRLDGLDIWRLPVTP